MAIHDPVMAPPTFLSRQVRASRRFHLDLRPDPRTPWTVVCGGWEECDRTYDQDRPGFPFLALEIVASGRGELDLAGNRHALRPGLVFTYGPGVRQRIRADPAHPPRKYFLDLAGPEVVELLAKTGLSPGAVRLLPDPAPALAQAEALIATALHGGPGLAGACAHLARALVLTCGHGAVAVHEAVSPAHATFRRCHALIEDGDGRFTSVAQVAIAAGISPEHLGRLYGRFCAMTALDHLTRVRLRRAPDLLRDPSRTVAAVAGLLGYTDPFQFSRVFTRCFGAPPSAVRRLGMDHPADR